MEPWLTLGYRSETLFNYLVCHDPGLYRYAVLVSGELAGTLCVRFPWFLGPYIEMIAICPPCQGRNIGRDILTWVESRAAHSSRNLWAAVSSFNSKARLFYRSQGFDEVAVLDDLVKKGSAELLLRKRLTPLVGYPVMSSGTDAVVE
jgi:ribosomal protein S18 acetylase RimI-like enzyme